MLEVMFVVPVCMLRYDYRRDDITDWVPVSTDRTDKETGEKMLVTQYEGSVIEDTGLIKMDFLGLKTLSIIKEAVENIRLSRSLEIDVDQIDITDPATYKLYSDGRTIGTFQFESAGMQKYLRELQPSTFEDLIAMNASIVRVRWIIFRTSSTVSMVVSRLNMTFR